MIPFMALMKEVSFISDTHIPKPEVFCKLFEGNQICIAFVEYKNNHQEQTISLLSIIISKASYKRRLFGYAILIHKKKHRKFSLIHSTENGHLYTKKMIWMVT